MIHINTKYFFCTVLRSTEISRNATFSQLREGCTLFCSELDQESFIILENHDISSNATFITYVSNSTLCITDFVTFSLTQAILGVGSYFIISSIVVLAEHLHINIHLIL